MPPLKRFSMAFADPPPCTVQWLVEKTGTIYSLPLFYQRLSEAINHPRTSLSDISKVITEDQGLTTRLLRLANSPMFGYFGKVDSINCALTIIGTQQLRDLALAASVMGVFKGIPEELLSMEQFWKHSIACGIIARSLAIWRRESNVERFFLAGMLHDIGQLIMATAIGEKVQQMLVAARENQQLFMDQEQQQLGFTHADAGAALLREWKIPANISEPVGYHHKPAQAEQFPLEAALVHIADIICHALFFGQSCTAHIPPLEPLAWEHLGMIPSELSATLKQAEPQIEETFSILATA